MSRNETLNRPEIADGDLDICCDLQVGMVLAMLLGGGATTPAYQCEEPARWVGFYPCCGKHALVCDMHRADDNPFYCSTCKRHANTLINWMRL